MKYKKLANKILITLLISFLLITLFKVYIYENFFIDMLSFTVEAALIGGIADWFAITALFKEPLGFSWHTAIIPKNRKKVIDAITLVVENELLSVDIIKNKINAIRLSDIIINFVDKSEAKLKLSKLLLTYTGDILNKLDTKKISCYIENILKSSIRQIPLGSKINQLFYWSINNGTYDKLLASIIDNLITTVKKDSTKDEIHKLIQAEIQSSIKNASGFKRMLLELSLGVAEGTDSINLKDASSSIQQELVKILENIKDKDNEMYSTVRALLELQVKKLELDNNLANDLESWKEAVLEEMPLAEELDKLINGIIRSSIPTDNGIEDKSSEAIVTYNPNLHNWIIGQLDIYWNNFKKDDKLNAWVDNYLKELLYKIVKTEHHLLGNIIREALSSFTDDALNEFIESKAGNDLHWIRINGSIVGAITGLAIFLFTNLFYDPFVIPFITNLFK